MRRIVASAVVMAVLAVYPAVSAATPHEKPAALAVVDVEARYEQGVAVFWRGDYGAAYRLFRPLAEQGDAGAQSYLGEMYNEGLGVPHDDRKAAGWHRKAVT